MLHSEKLNLHFQQANILHQAEETKDGIPNSAK